MSARSGSPAGLFPFLALPAVALGPVATRNTRGPQCAVPVSLPAFQSWFQRPSLRGVFWVIMVNASPVLSTRCPGARPAVPAACPSLPAPLPWWLGRPRRAPSEPFWRWFWPPSSVFSGLIFLWAEHVFRHLAVGGLQNAASLRQCVSEVTGFS